MTTAPPEDLGDRGLRFWTETVGVFELTDSEQELLVEVCRTLDDLQLLAEAVRQEGAMVGGSAGQPVVNPALTEARGQRAILHRLLTALQLPDPDAKPVPSATTARARTAAAARWRGSRSDAG